MFCNKHTFQNVSCSQFPLHYNDVIMSAMASQITSLTIASSTVYSGTDQRKHQSSSSLAFERGIHWAPVNSPNKGPVTRRISSFDDVIMPKPPRTRMFVASRPIFWSAFSWQGLSCGAYISNISQYESPPSHHFGWINIRAKAFREYDAWWIHIMLFSLSVLCFLTWN